jgi:hypothetical protein
VYCPQSAAQSAPFAATELAVLYRRGIGVWSAQFVDSDICRNLIDLERCLYLQENGYDALYREELLFAQRKR